VISGDTYANAVQAEEVKHDTNTRNQPLRPKLDMEKEWGEDAVIDVAEHWGTIG
jgi:hypothetical protein